MSTTSNATVTAFQPIRFPTAQAIKLLGTLAKREPDEHGRAHVDEEMMRRLEAKLAAKVLLFRTE